MAKNTQVVEPVEENVVETVAETVEEKTVESEPVAESGKKMVTVQLPLNPMNRKDDSLFVSVNGESYQIKRGVPVEVPEYIAEVIANAYAQKAATMERINNISKA